MSYAPGGGARNASRAGSSSGSGDCEVGDRHLTIIECRAPWREDFGLEWTRFPIARLRYTKASKRWSLYWRDRNLRFHEYDLIASSASIEDLLAEIDRDPTGIFWG